MIAVAVGVGASRSPRDCRARAGCCCASRARSPAWARASSRSGSTGWLLAPAHWDELGDGLDRGFAALGSAQWPYDGTEPWTTLTLLLAMPLVLSTAAALAFWPGRALRPFALVLLVALYGVAVTEHQFDGELGSGNRPARADRGVAVAAAHARARLARGRRRRRGVVVACMVALPAAARYEDRDPLDRLRVLEPVRGAGHDELRLVPPLRADRLAARRHDADARALGRTPLLEGRDARPLRRASLGRAPASAGATTRCFPRRTTTSWETSFRVTIRELDTDLFPIAGTTLQIIGRRPGRRAERGRDGRGRRRSARGGRHLHRSTRTCPSPTPDQMRGGGPRTCRARCSPYTQIFLPSARPTFEGSQFATTEADPRVAVRARC